MLRALGCLVLCVLLACAKTQPTQASSGDCIVGDPNLSPSVSITEAPGDCCYGSWAGDVKGTVNNVKTAEVKIVLYAQTNVYWVQPFADQSTTSIDCNGEWSNRTHGGRRYCAILCKRSWTAPTTLGYLPPIGEDILAVACAPSNVRQVQFSGYTWNVKANGDIPVDPGPNYFSDSEQNVWVDGEGLHLRMTNTNGRWNCPEVFSDHYFSYGRFSFSITGQVDKLDPNVIAAGFVYAGVNREIDFVEFSRWGETTGPNAQNVVQPWENDGNRHRYSFTLTEPASTHSSVWAPDSVLFVSRQGGEGGGALINEWLYTGVDIPEPAGMRMHFNVWLFEGLAPNNGEEVEIVINRFDWEPLITPVVRSSWGKLKSRF